MNTPERASLRDADPELVENQYRSEDGMTHFASIAELHYFERATRALERIADALEALVGTSGADRFHERDR